MLSLNFTTKVLGKAAGKLRNKQLFQTIRGVHSNCVVENWRIEDTISIFLDGRLIGEGKVMDLRPIRWEEIEESDARAGGFDNILQLGSALRRAGYRFATLYEYQFYRLRFSWSSKSD